MLTPRTVFDIHKITDAESSRYSLGGVRFERDEAGRPLAVATDGRRLMVLGWQEPDAANYPLTAADSSARLPAGSGLLIPANDCREAAKFKVGAGLLKSKPFLGCSVIDESAADGQPVKIAASNLEKSVCDVVKQIEGRYPKWRDIVTPAVGEAVHSITVSADMLIEILEVAGKHCRLSDGTAQVVLSLDAVEPSNRQLTITAANADGTTAYGVLMPVCDGSTKTKHAGAAWLPVEFSQERIETAAAAARRALAESTTEATGEGETAAGNSSASPSDDWYRVSCKLTEELNVLKAEMAKREREAANSAQSIAEAVAAAVVEVAAERDQLKAAAAAADTERGRADAKADRLATEVRQLRAALATAHDERDAARADKLTAEKTARQAAKTAAASKPAAMPLAKPVALTVAEDREPGRRFSHTSPPVSIPLARSAATTVTTKATETPRAVAARVNGAASRRPAWQLETDEDRRRIVSAVHC
jgi:hypothetical protein